MNKRSSEEGKMAAKVSRKNNKIVKTRDIFDFINKKMSKKKGLHYRLCFEFHLFVHFYTFACYITGK